MARQTPKPHRPEITREKVVSVLRSVERSGCFDLSAGETRDILLLALDTFNDTGTSGAELDEELCHIDSVLRKAGYDFERGAPMCVEQMARRLKSTEKRLKAALARERRRKPKARSKKGRRA